MESRPKLPGSTRLINISQQMTKPKLHTYLSLQNRHPDTLNDFTAKKWFCHGYGCLGLYAQYLETANKQKTQKIQSNLNQTSDQTIGMQKNNPDQSRDKVAVKESDDWNWFQTQLEILSAWKGKIEELSESEIKNIDRLIEYLNMFQNSKKYLKISQGKLHQILDDTEKRKIKLEYSFAGLFTANDFIKKLTLPRAKEQSALIEILTQYDKRLILISCGNHTLTLFKSGTEISFYHASQKYGRRIYPYSSIRELGGLVSDLFKSYKFCQDQPSPFGFRIFTFDKHLKKYPEANLLLNQFHHPLITNSNCKKRDYSALHIAARIGSKKCVKYYLDKGAEVDYQAEKKTTALYIATFRNHYFIAEMLLLQNADINKPCGMKNKSPLIKACEANNVKMINTMLKYGQKVTFADFITAIIHLKNLNMQYQLINSINDNIASKIFGDLTFINNQLKTFKQLRNYNKEIYQKIKNLAHKYKNVGAERMKLFADETRFFNPTHHQPANQTVHEISVSSNKKRL